MLYTAIIRGRYPRLWANLTRTHTQEDIEQECQLVTLGQPEQLRTTIALRHAIKLERRFRSQSRMPTGVRVDLSSLSYEKPELPLDTETYLAILPLRERDAVVARMNGQACDRKAYAAGIARLKRRFA